ncbi:hypothetical protein TWF225_008675 [Orbilia oligospora]|nr:hypothetical protein TWF225_008675 [Orbilia oligospora]KAF3252716.1 hypothetical protein TWF128_006625 [Orbilia oligospora]KAF3252825.1 hypothetical protein TWF217_007575 [Orbilia oligospora]
MATPFDRKNQQVWDTLNAPGGSAKQALQLIARRLKKGEKGDYLTAMRAFILAHLPTAGLPEQTSPLTEALQICNSLAFRTPPTKDSETIRLIEMTYIYLGKKEEIGKFHEHLYKARIATPGRTKNVDEAGLKEWYSGCMRACDWTGMQKAAMALQKGVMGNRGYYFWAVAACFIMVVACDDDQRSSVGIFGMLASRMISKAASEIPEGKESGPIRSIRTAAELQLFYDILSFTKVDDVELVKYLESQTTGFNSRLGSDSYWEFWWMLVETKLRLQEFKDVNDHCLSVLSTGSVAIKDGSDGTGLEQPKVSRVWKDDWKVWAAYVASAVEIGAKDPEDPLFTKAAALLAGKLKDGEERASRNALLAAVEFASLCRPHSNLNCKEDVSTLLAVCFTFFEKQGGTSSCYDDLRPYVAQLNTDEQKELLVKMTGHCKSKDIISSESSTKELTNAVREWVTLLKFWFWIEIDNQERLPVTEGLNDFVQECLAVYNVSLKVDIDLLVTDMRIGDELLLLVAKALMCKYTASRMQDPLPVRVAIIILEHLLTKSKHNFTALLMLVRLYMIIGAPSCATIEYQRLSIKQIQNDSLSHHVLTRLSTLLPFSVSSAAKLLHPTDMADVGMHVPHNPTDSLEMYDISLRLYKNANRTNPEMISLAFKNGAYGQIKDMVLFEKRVSSSISACQFEIERRRVQRFRGVTVTEGSTTAAGALWDRALNTKTSDNRTFDLFGEDGWHTGCDMGPRVGVQWVQAFLLTEHIVATLVAQSQASSAADSTKASSAASGSKANEGASEKEHVPFSKHLRGILEGGEEGVKEFTGVERQVLDIVCLMGDIQVESEGGSKSSGKVKLLLTEISSKFQTLRGSFQPPSKGNREDMSSAVGDMSQLSLDDGQDRTLWYSLHQAYMILEACKHILILCEYLEKSPVVKALKPQIPKSQITEIKNMIGSSWKAVVQMAKEQAKDAVQVTESDIDAVLSCKGLDMASVAEFVKTTIGRGKVESYMDKIAGSRSSTWAAVGGVKIG